jgi:hypothetical protein
LWITSLMGVKVYEESECIGVSENSTVEELWEIISHHVGTGLCSSLSQSFEGCNWLHQQLNLHCEDKEEVLSGRIAFLTAVLSNTKCCPLEQLLKANGVNFELRRTLKNISNHSKKLSQNILNKLKYNVMIVKSVVVSFVLIGLRFCLHNWSVT